MREATHPHADLLDLTDLLNRFSVDMTDVIDRAMGTSYASNREILALVALLRLGPQTKRSLSTRSGLPGRGVSALIHRLETSSIVSLSKTPGDHRAILVSPTRLGRTRGREMQRNLEDYFVHAQPLAKDIVEMLTSGGEGHLVDEVEHYESTLDLLDRIAQVGVALGASIRERAGEAMVTGRQQVSLLQIVSHGRLRPSELAELLALTSGGVTYVVDQLEARSLVTRDYRQESADRRAVTVVPTAAGEHLAGAMLLGFADRRAELCQLFLAIRSRPLRP